MSFAGGGKGRDSGSGMSPASESTEALDSQFPASEREGGRQQRAGVWLSTEHLPKMGRAPGSIPSATKNKMRQKRKTYIRIVFLIYML